MRRARIYIKEFVYFNTSFHSLFPSVCLSVISTLGVHPLELSVRDKQLILTTAAAAAVAGKRGLKALVTTLFRQLVHHYVDIWKAIRTMRKMC